ncbi:MAG: carboxypeptidase regulatory-like domain-containing protein, partial [Sphingomicrobium sp.]
MRKSILRASAAMQTIALLGVGATAFIAAAPAAAQDYTSGALVGSVHSAAGAPVAGATVTLRSIAQGQVRNLVTGASGTFNAAGLTPGDYTINIAAGGYNTHAGTISIVASQTNSVDVGLETAASGNAIVVTGSRLRQSVTQGTTGANINVVKVNEQLPIGHDITDITLLAPTTLRGVSGFATAAGDSVPSVGGGSVAENAYYVNGLNITNPDTYVGGSRVPFYLYQNVDVQTGGYPAEFGRATGGVINATTKSGSNIPFVALHLDWEPNFLRSHSPNRGNPDSPTDIGRLRSIENRSATLEAGGAVVPDHLFVYGLLQANRNTDKAAYPNAGQYEIQKDNDPFYAFKIDGYITPTQHAEFTYFDTRSKINIFDYDFEANDAYTDGTIGTKGLAAVQEAGGVNWIARYTGNITDWLTASAAYGLSKDKGSNQPADNTSYYVIDRRTVTTGGNAKAVGQPFATQDILNTRRRFYRGDMDARFTFGGTHHVRFGFDHEDLSENKIAT